MCERQGPQSLDLTHHARPLREILDQSDHQTMLSDHVRPFLVPLQFVYRPQRGVAATVWDRFWSTWRSKHSSRKRAVSSMPFSAVKNAQTYIVETKPPLYSHVLNTDLHLKDSCHLFKDSNLNILAICLNKNGILGIENCGFPWSYSNQEHWV